MSDTKPKQTVPSDLPRWIEQDYREFLARRIFGDYLKSSSGKPFYLLLQNYGAATDGGNFPDFLDFLKSSKGKDALRDHNNTIRLLGQSPVTQDIPAWNAEYEVYQRKVSIENPPTLEEFLKDSSGKLWRPALESYLDTLQDKDSNADLSGFLRFVNNGIHADSVQVQQEDLKDQDGNFLEKLETLKREWPPEDLVGSIEDLNKSTMLLPFILRGTPEEKISKDILRRCFAFVCYREGFLQEDSQGKIPTEVTSECLKIPEGQNSFSALEQGLERAWLLTATLYRRTMDGITIINQNKNTPSYQLVINELTAQCTAGRVRVLGMVADFMQSQSEGGLFERNRLRGANSGFLKKGQLSDSAVEFLEKCRNQNEESQSPGARALREAVASAIEDVRAIFQAGGRG
jgi:hypothetical protein